MFNRVLIKFEKGNILIMQVFNIVNKFIRYKISNRKDELILSTAI